MKENTVPEIIITNLCKRYDVGKKSKNISFAVNSISLSVNKGSVFGFLGPNGAGKTSTIKMLVGLSRPTSGTITINGANPTDIEVQKIIGFMPEAPSFYQYLTAQEFLTFIAQLFSIEHPQTRLEKVLHQVNLLHVKDKKIRTYSKGMLQRLGLAQALINDPHVIFLDEALDGLDPLGRKEVKNIILDLKKDGKTIFLNTHILGDVEEICDRVAILDHGNIIAEGSPQELTTGYSDLEEAFVAIITASREKALVTPTVKEY